MELGSHEVVIHRFVPDDENDCAAVRVTHKASRTQVINDDTVSQRENLRRAMTILCEKINPNPAHIEPPGYMMFDQVKVRLPDSLHEGEITKILWDFTPSRWKYYVDCHNDHLSRWYDADDLTLESNDD